MTAPLPYFPECKKPEYAVRNPQCRKIAGYSGMTAKAQVDFRHERDGFRSLENGSGIAFNSLKNNHYCLMKFTTARSVYIFFKIYIPAAVTVVRNGKQEQQRKSSWQN